MNRFQNLLASMLGFDSTIEQLSNQITYMNEEIRQLKATNNENKLTIEHLTSRCVESEKKIETSEEIIKSYEKEIENIMYKLDLTKADLDNETQTREKLQDKHSTAVSEYENKIRELQSILNLKNKSIEQHIKIEEQHIKNEEQLNNKVKELKNKIKEFTAIQHKMQEENNAVQPTDEKREDTPIDTVEDEKREDTPVDTPEDEKRKERNRKRNERRREQRRKEKENAK